MGFTLVCTLVDHGESLSGFSDFASIMAGNSLAQGASGRSHAVESISILGLTDPQTVEKMAESAGHKLWKGFSDFGSIMAGNSLAQGASGRSHAVESISILSLTDPQTVEKMAESAGHKLWKGFSDLGSIMAGLIGAYLAV